MDGAGTFPVKISPAQDRREKMGLNGWLIGDWTMEATVHLSDGNTHLGCGEIRIGWVLELGGCRTKRFRI